MTRALAVAVVLLGLTLGSSARAQVDFAKIRAGVQGCPQLAADAGLGSLAAFFCEPLDRTILDLPVSGVSTLIKVRAGSFSLLQRYPLLAAAQGTIPDSQYAALVDQLFAGEVPSIPVAAQSRSLFAEAAQAEAAGDPLLAAQLRSLAETLIAGSFDVAIPDLLLARIDRDRLADLRAGRFTQIGGADTVASYASGLARNLNFVQLSGAPDSPFVSPDLLTKAAFPFFVGPDGLGNTADDLPYVANNPAAAGAGYVLAAPIAGTAEDRFDRVQGAGVNALAVYTKTAQITVPTLADPSLNKLIEVYGVYNPSFVKLNGCQIGLGGTYNRQTQVCTDSLGNDITAAALAAGCPVLARSLASTASGIGVNADGDCIELNTSSSGAARVQVEVLPKLGDPALRPAQAAVEPADLTDLKLRSTLLPARPVSADGTISFPMPAGGPRRGVDLASGAPVNTSGGRCQLRFGASGLRVGPNGIPGDGDDAFPSAGSCLLWGAPDPNGAQHLLPGSVVAASHTANQSLFHALCSASFDADYGQCSLDSLNDPDAFDFLSATLGGLGGFAGPLLTGTETIRPAGSPLESIASPEQLTNAFASFQFLAINPNGAQNFSAQDLGLNLPPASAALLGCGPGFASPCSRGQGRAWGADPSIVAGIGLRQSGGIDLLNTDASVLTQEFAVEKALHADALVGVAPGGASYLPGMNFSRDGTFVPVMDPDSGLTVDIETGSTLALTPANVLAMTPAERASYQHGGANKVQADGWVEPMAWAVDPGPLATFGAIVFRSNPSSPLSGPGNVFVPGGEYCGRWMIKSTAVSPLTPFNETCTALETASANYERLIIAQSIIGQDRDFDPPESLAELVAMLDDDPSNDATGDPVSGPDGIFANNQFVFRDDQMDFQVVALKNSSVGAQIFAAPADKDAALTFLRNYDPTLSCIAAARCYLDVSATLSDPDDAHSSFPLILALPIGYSVDRVVEGNPNEPPIVIAQTKVNLARLQNVDRHTLLMLLAGKLVTVNGEVVQMNEAQRDGLLTRPSTNTSAINDLDLDSVNDLDADRDGIWDGADDFSPGPVSDDEVLCGSGILGDTMLESGMQFEPYRADEKPGSAAFHAAFPNGLPPRSPVFCRSLNRLLSLVEPAPDGTRRFVWHGSTGSLGDGDFDGQSDALDNCPVTANASQQDTDGDGVGDTCDNCVSTANPRVAADYLTLNAWATLTGGQRDDDHDGYGNRCDAKFDGGVLVGTGDLAQLRASLGQMRSGDTCGTAGSTPCAGFDLDENAALIGSPDLTRFRIMNGRKPGPKCPACPLACTAGTAGSCAPTP